MDAASLWSGNDYAWIPQRGRYQNVHTFTRHVKRVTVERVKKVRLAGNYDRRTTMVTFEVLDWDGNSLPEEQRHTVPAREIVEHWHEYHGVHEEQFKAHIEKQRQEAQQAQQAKDRRQAILTGLDARGWDTSVVGLNNYSNDLRIPFSEVERWLATQQVTFATRP